MFYANGPRTATDGIAALLRPLGIVRVGACARIQESCTPFDPVLKALLDKDAAAVICLRPVLRLTRQPHAAGLIGRNPAQLLGDVWG